MSSAPGYGWPASRTRARSNSRSPATSCAPSSATSPPARTISHIIKRQSQELLELSTPVVRLWEKILALPLIGTLDSERTQTVMENLLNNLVQSGAEIAIIDIT